MLSTAIQNTFIKASANLVAQLAAQWGSSQPSPLDIQRILEFACFGFIGAHIGYIWHHVLEDNFPTKVTPTGSSSRPIIAPGDKDDKAKIHMLSPIAEEPPHPQPVDQVVSYRNVLAKLVADQTVGLVVMITVFLIITNVARVESISMLGGVIREKLWRLLRAGWNIWPVVAVCNFLWVPVRWRVLVASCVGFGWNIFLSIVSMTSPGTAKTGQGS